MPKKKISREQSELFFLNGKALTSSRRQNKVRTLAKYKKLDGNASVSKQNPHKDRTAQTRYGEKKKIKHAGFSQFYITTKKFLPEDWKDKFLYQYATTGSIRFACEYADISRQRLDQIKKEDADFAQMMQYAKEDYNDALEQEIVRRGKDGIDEPLTHQGYLTGQYIKRYSDQLLLAKAKAEMAKYRDNNQTSVNVNIAENQVVLGFDTEDKMFQPD